MNFFFTAFYNSQRLIFCKFYAEWVNETCTTTTDCKTENSQCTDKKCVCKQGYLRDGMICRATGTASEVVRIFQYKNQFFVASILKKCQTFSDCPATNSVCSASRCVCMPGLVRDGLLCRFPSIQRQYVLQACRSDHLVAVCRQSQ